MKNNPGISVVVCAKNEERFIQACMDALSAQPLRPEIIVVDAHSKDRTVRIAKKYADRILYDNGKGISDARNVGWKAAKGGIVAYCDADAVPKKDWTKNISELLEKYDAVSGPLVANDGSMKLKISMKLFADIFPRLAGLLGWNLVWGANMAFRKSVLRKNPFTARFLEDYEIGSRLRKSYKVKFSKKISMPASTRRFEKSFFRTCIKYYILSFLRIKLTGEKDYAGYYKHN